MVPVVFRLGVAGHYAGVLAKLRKRSIERVLAERAKFLLRGAAASGSLAWGVARDPTEDAARALANRLIGNRPADDDFREAYCRMV